MLGRHVYRVAPSADGGWTVKKDGDGGTLVKKGDRQTALDHACRLAQKDEPARVLVESGDGKIEEERKFGLDPGQSVEPV